MDSFTHWMWVSMRSKSKNKQIALVLGLVILLLAPQASARRQAVALVVLPHQEADAAIAQAIRRDILKTFTQDPTVQLVDPLKQKNSLKAATNPIIEESLAEGKALLRMKQYNGAVEALVQARQDIHAEISKVSKSTLSDTMVHLAAAYLGAKKRNRARQTLRALLTWRSQHNLMLETGPPPRGWRKLTQKARKWLARAPTGSARITTRPSRAEAFVDGRRIGSTPIQASNLVVGIHYVTLKRDGYKRLVLPVRVKAGPRTISATLRSDPKTSRLVEFLARARASIGSPRMGQLHGLERELGASRVLFVLVAATRSTREITASLYQLNDQQLLAKTVLDTGTQISSAQLSSLALWRIRAQIPVRPIKIATPSRKRHRARQTTPFYKTWWFWTLAGVGVAGAGLSVALPLALSEGSGSDLENFYLQW